MHVCVCVREYECTHEQEMLRKNRAHFEFLFILYYCHGAVVGLKKKATVLAADITTAAHLINSINKLLQTLEENNCN